jgi:hypothetical protein
VHRGAVTPVKPAVTSNSAKPRLSGVIGVAAGLVAVGVNIAADTPAVTARATSASAKRTGSMLLVCNFSSSGGIAQCGKC